MNRGISRRWLQATLAVVIVACVGVLEPRAADAAPISDAEPGAAALIAARVSEIDRTLRSGPSTLATAEQAVAVATAARATAAAEEQRVLAGGAPGGTGMAPAATVIDAATRAILDSLGPEHATAARQLADLTLATAVTQSNAVRASLDDAVGERARLLDELGRRGLARTRWSVALLDLFGFPVTPENLRGLAAWIGAESNAANLLNPLATTMPAPGARDANEVGVKGYPSEIVGLDATARTLRLSPYAAIRAALAHGDSALAVVRAVAASPWGTGENAVRRLVGGTS